jgi:DNA replication and repair protein RecF
MRLLSLSLRDFRSYERAEATIGERLTVIAGPNAAGKTNLLEAIYLGCTGRSPRTANDRELVRFGGAAAHVSLRTLGEDGPHHLVVGVSASAGKRIQVDGAPVERLLELPGRPLVSVFMPDRLELVKGTPALRRAHLDQFLAALWPARRATRRAYGQALAQRNALLSRIRAARASRGALAAWDEQLARLGIELMADRSQAVAELSELFPQACGELGLEGAASIAYRPRSHATTAEQLAAELAERVDGDLERGFTGHGPHRDELLLSHGGRELRTYGSQGQQRLALLALLLAEREALARQRGSSPLILLDDVMSELDGVRRNALAALLRAAGGQAVITTTDLEHVPGALDGDVWRLAARPGAVLGEAAAAA